MLRLIIKHSNYVFLEFLIAKYGLVSMLIKILNQNYIFFRPVESLTIMAYIMAHQGFKLNLEGKVINISLPNNFQFTTLLCPKPKHVFN